MFGVEDELRERIAELECDPSRFWRCCGEWALMMRIHLIYRIATDEKFVVKMFGLNYDTAKGRLRLIAGLATDAELVIE